MSDTTFLLSVLERRPGDWFSHHEILEWSRLERGCQLTVHSRAADLRKRGHTVECRTERDARGRTVSYYRLGTLTKAGAASPSPAPAPAAASVPETLFGETPRRRPLWA